MYMYMYKAPVSHTLNKISTIVSVSNVAVLQLRVRGVDHNGSGDEKFSLGFDPTGSSSTTVHSMD